jgi:hypothetical protein
MFLVDDVLKKALDYFFDRVKSGRAQHDTAIKSIRIAMRAIASSLKEITLQLETGVHRLRRVKGNRTLFFRELQGIVDSNFLREACNESGICQELRIAQDELVSISPLHSSDDLHVIGELAYQLEGYEGMFVEAVREFLSQARDVDLTMANVSFDHLPDTQQVIDAFDERLKTLSVIQSEIEKLLTKLRESSLGD